VVATFLMMLPYGLVAALSPMMFAEQTLILSARHGRRVASAYAVGAVFTLFGFVSALVFFGRAVELPDDPSLSAWLDIVIGAVMLIAAALIHHHRSRPVPSSTGKKVPSSGHFRAGLGFGVFSMATNFKALALMVPAAKVVVTSASILPERIVLVAVIVVIASIPAWLPLALTAVAPDSAERVLKAIRRFLDRHGRRLVMTLLLLLGTFLMVRGLILLS